MTEYEYAVQWHYEGRQEWYTLVPRYNDVETARLNSEWIMRNYTGTKVRVVRRLKSKWEVVE